MPAQPDKGLHANRRHSVPTDDTGPTNCFSRGDLLAGRTPSAFGSDQSVQICVDTNEKNDPDERPHRWDKAGRVLRVPKVVILSSLPFWTVAWKASYFYAPRDVIGVDSQGNFGNYYYFEQWDAVDQSVAIPTDSTFSTSTSDPAYTGNQVWKNFDKSLTAEDKATVYNARASCLMTCSGQDCSTCELIPSSVINVCSEPPAERFSQIVCRLTNPYYELHRKLLLTFASVKEALESDPLDPIYVDIPGWMPPALHQTRNAFLKKNHEKLNEGHGGSPNQRPCDVSDAVPCYTYTPVCWAPAYPDKDDPRNVEPFQTPGVPWLLSTAPGFGTNVLHIYVGHPCMKYFTSDSVWDWQAWPLTPEVQWIAGPVFQGSYLGDVLPFFAGRRAIWRDAGFDYGYTGGITARSLYDTRYGPLVEAAAAAYKANFYKFRNLTTRIFTYPARWTFPWDTHQIWLDQEDTCPATQFYFGFTFQEFAAIQLANPDNRLIDCSGMDPAHLKVAEASGNFPGTPSLKAAEEVFFPPIRARIEAYYRSIEPGSADFYQVAIDANDLAAHGVSYAGELPGALLDPDGLIAYIRAYFKDNP